MNLKLRFPPAKEQGGTGQPIPGNNASDVLEQTMHQSFDGWKKRY
jgi:hypothetical protein